MPASKPEISYVACFTRDDGVYACEHRHPSVREAMNCLVPNGGSFIRAHEAGNFRSLSNPEFIDYLESLEQLPWSWRHKAQAGAPAIASAEKPNKEPVGTRE